MLPCSGEERSSLGALGSEHRLPCAHVYEYFAERTARFFRRQSWARKVYFVPPETKLLPNLSSDPRSNFPYLKG
jgi:hypothetical protein